METRKPALSSVPVHDYSIGAQADTTMEIQAPLTAVYVQTVPTIPIQPYLRALTDTRETSALHLAMPSLYSKETLPFLTLHLAGGLQPQLGLSAAASTPPSVVKPKSAGKHVCPHCGRDCMKPSVLEKHLRCHTGERPYPCTTCGVSFKTQSNLYKHRRTQAHARQSSESEQSNVGSLDSMSSSRETCSFSLSFDEQSEQLGSEVKHATLSSAETTNSLEVQSSVSEQREKTTTIPNAETNDSKKVITEGDKQNLENTKNVLNINRHLQLQRQEATLFSKQWESSLSRGKSQSHGSTDSGFSESSDPYPSPSSVLHEHCADSHSRSSREHLDENHNTSLCSEEGHGRGHEKDTAREQVQKRLEERISKLISENSVVVEDKQLENVRPRKTVLSKQGSIDLPMPYTYKDSFHFDIKINPAQSFGIPRHHKPGLYNSVPTQGSATIEHVTLPRSNSLPSHPTLLQPERERSTSYSQNDHAQDIRRRSSGQMNPTGLLMKPVNQHSSAHRPLVRQTAVDCNHTTDSPLTTSSVEEACTRRLSCDPDGNDIIGERNSRRLRRKKAQKFAYNKWYMYGGGTFKKLYDPDNSGKTSAFKGRKCSTNISQETDQNIPKMVSLIHKETITSSGSTVHFSTSNGSGGHHSPKSSGVSSVDVNVQSCQLNSPNGFVKAPPRRHLSLSVLPLSGTRSAAVHTECLNQTEAGRLINVAKPSDTTMELCKPHVPSDRKKQKTVEKMTSPLESEIEPNTQTQEPVSVTGSADSEVTGPTFFKAKEIPNSLDLKRALLFPYLLNTNASQISTSAATSVPIDANTSFLPKYQLNLPNAHEPDLVSLPQDMSKSKATDGNYPTPALLYNSTNQTSVTAYKNIFINPITLPCMQAQDHPCLGLHSHSLSPSVSGMQKQFAAATITTNCFQDYTTRLCSTLLHGSKTATNSVHKQLPKPLANLTTSLPLPTLINQTSAATTTCLSDHLSYHSANPTLEQSQLLPESVLANPGNIVHVDSNAQVGRSCIVPLDEKAQNVFHVHTADLQICLQLISDEQMALIAPQIEHQSGPSMSQLCEIEGMTPEGSQKITNVKDNQKEDDRQVSLPRLMSDRVIPLQSVQHSDACKTGSLTQPLPSQSPSQHPHNNSHLIMVTQTRNSAGSIMATSASFRVETTGGNQTSETKQVIFPKLCAEENFFSNRRVSQIGMVPKKNSGQHESCVRCVSTSAAYPANLLDQQQKKTQHAGADVLQSRGGAVACKISRTESTESLKQVNSGTGIGGSVSLFSVNNSEVPRQLNLQGLVFHTQQVEPMSQSLIKQANMQLNRMEPSVNSCSSLESFPNEIRTVIRREYLEEPHALSTLQSSSVDIKKLDKSTSFQSPTTGITEEAQKDPSAQEHRETLVQPGRTEWKPKQNQGEPEKKHICLEEQGVDELTGDDQNRQFKTPESCCRNVAIRDMTKHKGEETNLHEDLYKISCLSEKHLESVSQKNSGISECPPPNPLQVPHTSQNSDLATSTNHPNLLDSSPLEINHLYPQQNGDGGIISYSQQMQDSCESNRSQHTPMPISSSETQNAFLCAEPSLQSFSRQDQTKSTTSLSAQQGYTTTSNYSCDVFKVQTTNNHSVLPDFRTLSSMYLSQIPKVCRSTGEMTGDIQILQDNHITISPSQPFSLLEKKVENMDAPDDFSSNSRNPEGSCSTNKYQSMFMIGPFHGYQSADCLSSGVRPVPTSQENTEDPSSSDDEGKLIIEL